MLPYAKIASTLEAYELIKQTYPQHTDVLVALRKDLEVFTMWQATCVNSPTRIYCLQPAEFVPISDGHYLDSRYPRALRSMVSLESEGYRSSRRAAVTALREALQEELQACAARLGQADRDMTRVSAELGAAKEALTLAESNFKDIVALSLLPVEDSTLESTHANT